MGRSCPACRIEAYLWGGVPVYGSNQGGPDVSLLTDGKLRIPLWLRVGTAILLVLVLIGLFRFTGLREYLDPEKIRHTFETRLDHWWALLALIPIYILAHTVMFSNAVLNAAVILGFGGALGWSYAVACSLCSASVFFALGYHLGPKRLHEIENGRFQKVKKFINKGGIGAVAAVRMVPIAPYSVVNTAAGAIRIRYRNFIVGTFLAHLPGTLTVAIVGEQLHKSLLDPSPLNIALLVAIILIGGGVIWFIQRRVRQRIGES